MTSIRLTPAERQVLLDHYRRYADPAVGHRTHILLLLADQHPWATIGAVLFCSFATISRWKRRFDAGGDRGRGGGEMSTAGMTGGTTTDPVAVLICFSPVWL